MGQFKPMVKMMTTEPSVILKLKKGGKVESKANGGFMPMQSSMPAGLPARGGSAPAAAPMKPSLAARRRAMNPNLLMKKGGATCEAVEEKLEKHESKPASKAHKAFKEGGLAKSGIIKTITKKTTKLVDGDKHDSAKGTKGVTEGKPGGYATGGVINGKPAGYKKGGSTNWENRPANDGDKFDPAHGTKGVRNANAGGYKNGGSTKKAFATGGKVDDGKAVAMPKKPVSRPVANSLQSGTFKKGGKVGKYASAGRVMPTEADFDKLTSAGADEVVKKTNRDIEEAMNPISMAKEGFSKVSDFVKSKLNPAGSVTKTEKSVTVAPPTKKRGGKVC